MRNKTIWAFGLMAAVLVLSGCSQSKDTKSETSSNPLSKIQETEKKQKEEVKDTLLNLLTTGAGQKCSIEDETGKYTMLAKGDKAKVDGFSYGVGDDGNEETGTMINDGTWVYMWSKQEGIKFNIKEMDDLSKAEQDDESFAEASDWKEWVKDMDESGVKYQCNPTVASDADFTPPSDVKFQDWGEMMKELLKDSNFEAAEVAPGEELTE